MVKKRDTGFRTINGIVRPFGDRSVQLKGVTVKESFSGCWPTQCPECKAPVFFIRHNGGCAWLDPPLGPPWPKHPCIKSFPGGGANIAVPDNRPVPPTAARELSGRIVEIIPYKRVKVAIAGVVVLWKNGACTTYRMNPRYRIRVGMPVRYSSVDGPLCIRVPKEGMLRSDGPVEGRVFQLTLVRLTRLKELARQLSVPPRVECPRPEGKKAMVKCPKCGISIRKSRLRRHLQGRCTAQRSAP